MASRTLSHVFRTLLEAPVIARSGAQYEPEYLELCARFCGEVAQVFCNGFECAALCAFFACIRSEWLDEQPNTVQVSAPMILKEGSFESLEVCRKLLSALAHMGFVMPSRTFADFRVKDAVNYDHEIDEGAVEETQRATKKSRKADAPVPEVPYVFTPRVFEVLMERLQRVRVDLVRRIEATRSAPLRMTYLCPHHGHLVDANAEQRVGAFEHEAKMNPTAFGVSYHDAQRLNMTCARDGCGRTLAACDGALVRERPGYDSDDEDDVPVKAPDLYKRVTVDLFQKSLGASEREPGDDEEEEAAAECEEHQDDELAQEVLRLGRIDISADQTFDAKLHSVCGRLEFALRILELHLKNTFEPLAERLRSFEPLAPPQAAAALHPELFARLPAAVGAAATAVRLTEVRVTNAQKPRPDQLKAAEACIDPTTGDPKSGVIIMPCGAGKTLVGILVMNLLTSRAKAAGWGCGDRIIVLCSSRNARKQWWYHLTKWTSCGDKPLLVSTFRRGVQESVLMSAQVILTTYHQFTMTHLNADSKALRDKLCASPALAMVFDEVHVVTATTFSRAAVMFGDRVHVKIGLTATLKHEGHEQLVQELVGPVIHESNIQELIELGVIARVHHHYVRCPVLFDPTWAAARNKDQKKRMHVLGLNPGLLLVARRLIRASLSSIQHPKIMVISDYLAPLFMLRTMVTDIRSVMVYGKTSEADQHDIFRRFKNNSDCNVLFISRLGDMALDLPHVNVLIQLTHFAGSLSQPVQRGGRVARKKMQGVNTAKNYVLFSDDPRAEHFAKMTFTHLTTKGFRPDWMDPAMSAVSAQELEAFKGEKNGFYWNTIKRNTDRIVAK